jgi:predicted  nucleic acid-binding Zn-ribbon protein
MVLSFSLAFVVLGQARPAVAKEVRDAGVVLPARADGGVADEPMRVPAPATTTDVDKVRKELLELRAKVSELEARLNKAEALSKDVDALRSQLLKLQERVDAAEERRESEEREAARKKAQAAQTQQLLSGALQQLATGNTTNVDAWLRTAQAASSGNAQKLVELARQALAQSDLVACRQYLTLALLELAPGGG